MLVFVRLIIGFFNLIIGLGALLAGREGFGAAITNMITGILTAVFITAFEWIWTKIGMLLVMKSRRESEYSADAFAVRMGFGDALCRLLESIDDSPEKGLFANLASSHPNKERRIERMRKMGCTY